MIFIKSYYLFKNYSQLLYKTTMIMILTIKHIYLKKKKTIKHIYQA